MWPSKHRRGVPEISVGNLSSGDGASPKDHGKNAGCLSSVKTAKSRA